MVTRAGRGLAAALLALALTGVASGVAARQPPPEIAFQDLPREAQLTLQRIRSGGTHPYARDGAVFGNYERLLQPRPRGYYREYTVPTPGARDRGARRIVTGDNGVAFYTDDHYRSFSRIRE